MESNFHTNSALITALYLEYGYISVPFIQRKLKVTSAEAERLIKELFNK